MADMLIEYRKQTVLHKIVLNTLIMINGKIYENHLS